MVTVEIKLVSAQGRHRDRVQQRLEISNVGGTANSGVYRYRLFSKSGKLMKEGTIADFPRKDLLACDLALMCLTDARGAKVVKRVRGADPT